MNKLSSSICPPFPRHLPGLSLTALLSLGACANASEVPDVALDWIEQGLSVCDETVPAMRFIDGIPAYAQCDAFANSAIYSNNGIDTSATKMGADWYRTQWSGGYQCTELATRYMHFKFGINYVPNGNAGEWCNTEPPANSGLIKTTTPVHGDLMVLAPGSCGAAAGTGHVNVVDSVDMAGGKLVAVEQNMARRGNYKISCGACFLHAKVNDGSSTPVDAGATTTADAGKAPTTADAGTSPSETGNTRDAGRRDAGKADAGKVTPPPADEEDEADEEKEEEKDAGRGKDAGKGSDTPDDDEEADDPTADETSSEGSEGCSVGDASSTANLTTFLVLLATFGLVQRRRRALAPVRR